MGEGGGVGGDDGPGVVVDGDDGFGAEEFSGFYGVVDAHGVVVADGEEGEVDVVEFADEFHVEEEAGVAGVVEGFSVDGEEEAGGIAHVEGAVFGGEAGAVVGDGEFDAAEGELVGTADVHAVGFEALVGEVGGDFVVGDDGGAGAFGDGGGVADVVVVAVGEEDVIALDVVGLGGGAVVSGEEGVDDEAVGGGFDEDAGMSEIGDFHVKKVVVDFAVAANFS